MVDLSKVTIFIKSFLRIGLLRDCLESIRAALPECHVLVIDDSVQSQSEKEFLTWPRSNFRMLDVVYMPFDSGFGAKSNEMIFRVKTPYVLIGSDDFNFAEPGVREGVIKLLTVLEAEPDIAIASGRVNNNPYESHFEVGEDWIREIRCAGKPGPWGVAEGVPFLGCALTVNYSLIRTSILGFADRSKVHWDDDVKIGGGEHGAFFIDVHRAGHRVVWVPGVNINELPQDSNKIDPRYPALRARASQPGRICLARRGIKRYGLADGTWEETC